MSDKSSFQKLLVPLDGSKYSKKALKRACEIAKSFDSKLVLVYVAEKSPINLLDRSEYLKILKEFGKKTLKDSLDFVQKNDLNAKTILKERNIVSEIEKISNKEKVDLIIVGNNGFGPVTRFLLGSVSSKLSQCRGSLDSMDSNPEYPILDSLTVNPERKSLEIIMETVPEKTDFWIRMPESVITAEKENFTVLIDGIETPYDLMKFPNDYVIGFIIDEDTTNIEIIGTYVIPEFGAFAFLILIISISAVVLFQNKMKFSFN